MDLCKAFDTIHYQILTAKLHTYAFSKKALKLILSYLKHRKQRVHTTSSFWVDLICGVTQGSVLGPFLFKIFLNDIFFFFFFFCWIIMMYVTLQMIQHLLFVVKILQRYLRNLKIILN